MELVDVTDSKSVGGDIVWVRVPPPAPNQYNPNLFPIGNGFGLFVFFGCYGTPHFRKEVQRKWGAMTTENNHKVIKKLKSSNLKIGYCSL